MDTPFAGFGGAIDQDLSCKRCGYNLRGLREENLCPECGTPVGRSTTADLLRFADPNWMGRVAAGVNLLVWALLLGILLGCLSGISGLFIGSVLPQLFVTLGMLFVNLLGVWWITTPDPSGIGEEQRRNPRKIVRFATIIAGIGGIWNIVGTYLVPGAFLWAASLIVMVATQLVGLINEWFKYRLYEGLAIRVPDPTLAGRARFLRWASAIILAVMLLGIIFSKSLAFAMPLPTTSAPASQSVSFSVTTGSQPAVSSTPSASFSFPVGSSPPGTPGTAAMPKFGAGAMVGMIMLGVAGIAMAIVGILTILFLLRLRKSLREQAQLAKLTWAANLGGGNP